MKKILLLALFLAGCALHIGTTYTAGAQHVDNVYTNLDGGR